MERSEIRESSRVAPDCASLHPGYGNDGCLYLPPRQILDPDAVALLDDLRDPLPVALRVIALVAENADRACLLDQGGEFVELLLGLRRLQVFGVDLVQQVELSAARG